MESSTATSTANNQFGYLELWMGPMFSGKTTLLIQTYKKYTYIGKQIVVVNYQGDQRYHDTLLSTHDKIMIPCVQTSSLSKIEDVLHSADVIFINEGQFFDDLFEQVIDLVDQKNKTVYISALDGDFQRHRFGRVLDLIPYCDKVTKLNALCAKCRDGTPAIFSHRKTTDKTQIVIGSDIYEPLCRKCYHLSQ